MLIPSNFTTFPDSIGLACALYLDAYTDAAGTTIYFPKRTFNEVRDPKRIPHYSTWTHGMHSHYLKVPESMPVEQFVILDDGWAERTIELLQTTFPTCLNHAARVAFYLWYNILFWASYRPGHGFVTTHERTAELCGCSVAFACRVTLAMLDAELIHRKWIGNGLGHFGTCYMAGPANNVDRLLESAENLI